MILLIVSKPCELESIDFVRVTVIKFYGYSETL